MESFGAENAARLATLQAARDSIDRTLDELGGVERRLRQEQITAEILEIVTGAATSGAASGGRALGPASALGGPSTPGVTARGRAASVY